MKKSWLIIFMLLALALAACGSGTGDEPASSSIESNDRSGAAGTDDTTLNSEAGSAQEAEAQPSNTPTAVLSADFEGALSPMAQLALGTVQLEESDLAVDEIQAAELLPLWQALQALSQSDTTADIELEAVFKQVSGSMTAEQIAAISAMQLSEEKLTELMDSGELGFGGFGRGEGSGGSGQGGGLRGGGQGGGLPGSGPGGGFPGGGPGGMGPGGFGGDLSEEELAIRRAEIEQGGIGASADRVLTGLVIRLLEDKTGVVSERETRGQVMNDAFAAAAEASGLSMEELIGQLAEGESLAEVVEQNGGDVDALADRLQSIFSELPDAQELDLEQSIADWLGME